MFTAATYGENTLLAEVRRLDSMRQWRVCPSPRSLPHPWIPGIGTENRPLEELVEETSAALVDYFRRARRCYGDRIASALSGGYDSRLLLALMEQVGMQPYLYVYGKEQDPDVQVAKAVAKSCGYQLEHIDRARRYPLPSPQVLAEQVARDYAFLDGIGHESGVFDAEGDLPTRRERSERAALHLNGGAGAEYRNFSQLPAWRSDVADFVRSHFDTSDFSVCRDGFDRHAYREHLIDKAHTALSGLPEQPSKRGQIELLLPLMRVRYWQAKNNMLNNQLTRALTPYGEAQFSLPSSAIPLEFKLYGEFEAAMLARLDLHLAQQSSAYGHNFADPVPLKRRLHDDARMYLPPAAMGLAKRRRARRRNSRSARPFLLEPRYVHEIFGSGPLMVDEWFRVQQMHDFRHLARALTVELLLRGS